MIVAPVRAVIGAPAVVVEIAAVVVEIIVDLCQVEPPILLRLDLILRHQQKSEELQPRPRILTLRHRRTQPIKHILTGVLVVERYVLQYAEKIRLAAVLKPFHNAGVAINLLGNLFDRRRRALTLVPTDCVPDQIALVLE